MSFGFAFDDIVRVDDKECFLMTRDMTRLEGIFCGGSGGAAVAGACKWARDNGKPGMTSTLSLVGSPCESYESVAKPKWITPS